MSAKKATLLIFVSVIAMLASFRVLRAQTGSKSDAAAAVSKIENDGVKADLSGDKAFYEKVLAEDWTGGDSEGKFYTKADILKMLDDPKNNKTNTEKLFDLKVRVYGNTAVATYKDTYDMLLNGQHRAHTIIGTDTFVKMDGDWKQVASHASVAK